MSWPRTERRKFLWAKAEKVLRNEIPPVATRRGRPVMSSGTFEVEEWCGSRAEGIYKTGSRKAETGKREHRRAPRNVIPRKLVERRSRSRGRSAALRSAR